MGLADLTGRVAEAENKIDYVKRWVDSNNNLLSSVADFNDRISQLEGATSTMFTDRLKDYSALFSGKSNEHGFIFFTDSHDLAENFSDYDVLLHMHFYRAIFENSPARYVLNGGDWINTKHTLEDAKYYIGRIPNMMRTEITEKSYGVIGNHELNIEGNYSNLDRIMSSEQIAQLWFGKNVGYYTVDYGNTRCYMFDSGSQSTGMTDYRWEQVDWFANSLITNTIPHLFGLIHIIYKNKSALTEQVEPELGDYITQVADAFNQRTSITLNGNTYDFSSAQGTFQFMLSGHYHNTQEHVYNNIPVIWSPSGRVAECIHVDFDDDVFRCVRIYMESTQKIDREINIIPIGCYSADFYVPEIISAKSTANDATNSSGTTLDSTDCSDGEFTVTQSTIGDPSDPTAASNGYCRIRTPNLIYENKYILKADVDFTSENVDYILLYPNTNTASQWKVQAFVENGKICVPFVFHQKTDSDMKDLEIRLCGNSFKMSNIRIYNAS